MLQAVLLRVPLLRVVAPFCVGILLEDALHLRPAAWGIGSLAGLLLWGIRPRPVRAALGESLLGVSLGALALALRLHAPIPAVGDAPTALTLLGAPFATGSGCTLLVFLHGDERGRARLRAGPEGCGLLPGALAAARVELEPFAAARNPGSRSRRDTWQRRGVQRAGRVQGPLVPAGAPPRSMPARIEEVRRVIGRALAPPDPEPQEPAQGRALLRALVLGDRSRLNDDVRASFARAGASHLLAVSGLHVGWVFAVCRTGALWLLGCIPSLAVLRRRPALATGWGAACAGSYALLTGPGIPALRAAAMAFAGTLALLGGRRATSWNALALAVLAVVALEPAAPFEPAFRLSFAAVCGIALWRPGGATLSGVVHCTLAAVLATAPFVALLGAPLPSAGWLSNLVAVPWFGAVLVPLALASAAVASAVPELGAPLVRLGAGVAELSLRLVDGLGSPDLLALAGRPALFAAGLTAAGFGLRLLALGHRPAALPLLAAAPLALGAGALGAGANDDARPSLVFLDVGHGDAVLLRSNGFAALIDAGPSLRGFDSGRSVVLPALRAEGVRRLDAFVLTHADRDHVGGAVSVVRGARVGELWMPLATFSAPALLPLRREAAQRGIPVRLLAAGDTVLRDELELRVLWPLPGGRGGSSNDGSLVLRVQTPWRCAMLPGDAPAWVERRLARGEPPCEILKLAHHGSDTSSDSAWLRALAPRVAIASAGQRSRAPLPHPRVRQRVGSVGSELWETSRCGALRVALDGALPLVRGFGSACAVASEPEAAQWRERPGSSRSARMNAARSPPNARSSASKHGSAPT